MLATRRASADERPNPRTRYSAISSVTKPGRMQGAGRVTLRIVFDLDTFQVLDGPEYLTTAGQHPLLDADWCEISEELLPNPA